jgi:hypothetical protein
MQFLKPSYALLKQVSGTHGWQPTTHSGLKADMPPNAALIELVGKLYLICSGRCILGTYRVHCLMGCYRRINLDIPSNGVL